jgi:hypothetical protein
MALGTQFSIGREPALAPPAARRRREFLEAGAVWGRFARCRRFWPDNGRFGRVSALLH